MARVYTIGHSDKSADEIISTLQEFSVTRLVDVRRFAASRSQPQFNSEPFSETLSQRGISYTHLVQLGGRRPKSSEVPIDVNSGWEHPAFHNYADYALGPAFGESFQLLLSIAQDEVCALMCAEALWWRCHRRIIADYVMASGLAIVHIFTKSKSEFASMTPFAVVGKDGIRYPSNPSKTARQDLKPSRKRGTRQGT